MEVDAAWGTLVLVEAWVHVSRAAEKDVSVSVRGPASSLPFSAVHLPECLLNNYHNHRTEAPFSDDVAELAAHQALTMCRKGQQVLLQELKKLVA